MVFSYALVIAVSLAVLTVTGGIIAALRLIPRPPTPDNIQAVRGELADLQAQFLDFADRYELSVSRHVAKVGKLRRKLAKATSDDLEEEEEYPDEPEAPPAPVALAPSTKATLWSDYNRQKGAA
jgi:hypothetical protein